MTAPLRLVFAGSPAAAVPSLRTLLDGPHDVIAVVTREDSPQGRKRILTPTPVARLAEKLGGIRMVAIAVDGHGMDTPGHDDVAALKSFIHANRGIRMRRYFYGATSFEAASAARRARFDYVQGTGVAPAMPVAGKVFRV